MKACNKCKKDKERDEFPSRGAVCKQCRGKQVNKWRKKNKENVKRYNKRDVKEMSFKEWLEFNIEHHREHVIRLRKKT